MAGGIYSREKCPQCGKNLRDTGRWMACPDHPRQRNDRGIYVKVFGLTRRFDRDYDGAQRFVNGVRFKRDEGSFDRRDYASDRPLSFDNLIAKWLEYKKDEVATGNYRNLMNYALHACDSEYLGSKNIKSIGYAELEDFSKSLQVTQKTRKNYLSALHHFFRWCYRRGDLDKMPEFPSISFVLGYRQVVGKETQVKIIEEVKRISSAKTWLGIKWLATYINVRPAEMKSLKEGHIDLEGGYLLFPHPKEKRYKTAPLIPEDVEILKTFPIAFSGDMPFFRHEDGSPFGDKHFYNAWKRACNNLGISGVDLYGGTRHSSARALRQHFSPERIKRAVGSATNAAFERYFMIEHEEVREVFSRTSAAPSPHQNLDPLKIGKVAKLKK